MADAILVVGGVGGVGSEEVTAKRAQVLKGYTTITADSNDEIVEGQIKIIDTGDDNYKSNISNSYGIDFGRGTFYIDLAHGNAYYIRGDGHPHTCIDVDRLGTAGADSVLQGQTATSQHGVKFEGTIPRWICTTGDIITSYLSQGHAWDDAYAGRGRGIVTRIQNGSFIQGANWVFLPSPNLYPQNIRAGVNINGIVGTLPDYSTGRVVFNGATFDGTLASGVAEKGYQCDGNYCAYFVANGYGYGGVGGGGMNLALDTGMPTIRGRRIGVTLSQSINLTPFRQVVIDYRANAIIQHSPFIDLNVYITKASNIRRNGVVVNGVPQDVLGSILATKTNLGYQGQWIIDVSNINEHALLSFTARADIKSAGDVFSGSMQITKIELIN